MRILSAGAFGVHKDRGPHLFWRCVMGSGRYKEFGLLPPKEAVDAFLYKMAEKFGLELSVVEEYEFVKLLEKRDAVFIQLIEDAEERE